MAEYPQTELHLLCVIDELQEMQHTLIDLYPDRDQLLAVYQRMKENLNQDYFEIDDVALVLKDTSRSHLTTCLKIFERAGSADPTLGSGPNDV